MLKRIVALLLALTVGTPYGLYAQSASQAAVMPVPVHQFFDNSGNPLAGGKLYTYTAGTLVPLETCTSSSLTAGACTVANANPVILDGFGRATVYLRPATYKFILKTSADVTIWTQDNVSSTNNFATSGTPGTSTYLRGDGAWSRIETVTTTAATGAQNNLDPGGTIAIGFPITYIRYIAVADTTISGFPAGFDGQIITIRNSGAGGVAYFLYNSVLSTAGNRLSNFATTGPTPVAAGGSISYQYSLSDGVWVMISHEQGAWIVPTFAAGNFNGNGGMGWTVDAGDLIAYGWHLSGRSMTVSIQITATTVVAPLNTALQIGNGAWGGFTAAKIMGNRLATGANNGVIVEAMLQVVDGTHLAFLIEVGGNWTAAVNNSGGTGQLTFEIL